MSVDFRELVNITHDGFSPEAGVRILEQLGVQSGRAAVISNVVSSGAAADTADLAAADAMGGIWGMIIVIACCILILVVEQIKRPLKWLASQVPLGQAGRVSSLIDFFFWPIDGLAGILQGYLSNQLLQLVSWWTTLTDWILPKTPTIQNIHGVKGTPPVDLTQVRIHISQLEQWDASLQSQINQINSRLDHTSTPPGTTVVPYGTQIHQLQQDVQRIDNTIAQIRGQIATFTSTASITQSDVNQIQAELHGIRATMATLPELESGVFVQISGMQSVQAAQQVQLQIHDQAITGLSPLMLLVGAGAAGLQNLRRLEDDICQCPKFADVPNELGAALAVWEALAYGV